MKTQAPSSLLTKPIVRELNRCLYKQDGWQTYSNFLTQIETLLGISVYGDPVGKNIEKYIQLAAEAYLEQVHKTNDWADILGETYMEVGRNNKNFGQFFTPQHVAKLMAELVGNGFKEKMTNNHLISTVDPTCGAGMMLLSSIEQTEIDNGAEGLLKSMYIGIDLDIICCRMTAIQIASNIFVNNKQIGEVIVINANTLTETITPKLILHGTAPGIEPTSLAEISTMVPRTPVYTGMLPLAVGFK